MRSVRSINSEFFREVASELDDQRASIARCVGLFEESKKASDEAKKASERSAALFEEAKNQLIELQRRQDRTHALLVDEANKLGTDIVNLKSRTTALERVVPGVAPAPAE